MTDFYIFRHGQTEWNRERRLQGLADNPVNDTGLQQAKELANLLRGTGVSLLAASPLKRAQQTVAVIAEALDLPIITDNRLREVDLGEADGMTFEAFREKFGEDRALRFITSTEAMDLEFALPSGEKKGSALNRALEALSDISQKTDSQCIGICCHGLIMRLLMRHSGCKDSYPMANGDLVHLVLNENKLCFAQYLPNKVKTRGIFGN